MLGGTMRGHGEGTIVKRADGRWEARISLDNGKRRSLYGRTRQEVKQKLIRALKEYEDGLPLPSQRQTVEQYLKSWLRDVAKQRVKLSTFQGYEQLLTRHAIPVIGKRPLAKLSPQDVQALYNATLSAGLKPQTVLNLHRTLNSALKQAVRWNLVARNVCELVDPPRVVREEVKPLDTKQASRFLLAAADDPLEALFVLALTTGMRQGELLALKWSDVDLEGGTLQVRRSVRRLKGHGFVEGEPKSKQSRRGLTLHPIAVAALARHRERQAFARRAAAADWEDRDLVFTNRVGGYIEVGNMRRRSYWPLLKRAGLARTVRFHDLRHTVASLMIEMDENLKVIQEQLGHADIATTANVYGHLSARKKREAALRLGELLAAGATSSGAV